jgi:hypothetical protein
VIVRTSYAKLADPSRRAEIVAAVRAALVGADHLWLHVGTPADEASLVWDLAVLAACREAEDVTEHHRRLMTALGEAAVVTKAWSFVVRD